MYGSHFHCESSSLRDCQMTLNRFSKNPSIRAYQDLIVFVTPWQKNEGGWERLGHFEIEHSGRHLWDWLCFITSNYLRKSQKKVTQTLFWNFSSVFWDWLLYSSWNVTCDIFAHLTLSLIIGVIFLSLSYYFLKILCPGKKNLTHFSPFLRW